MARGFLSSVLCCCYGHEDDEHKIPREDDESAHLIPDSLRSDSYDDQALLSQRIFQQRLDTIVRAKERKMVNVGSHMPFNLHNIDLPLETDHSLLRTTSETSEHYGATDDYSPEAYHPRRRRFSAPRFIATPSYDMRHSPSRSPSPNRDAESKPILNVRLVGFTDVSRRGRTMRRYNHMPSSNFNLASKDDNDLDNSAEDKTPTPTTFGQANAVKSPSCDLRASTSKFKLGESESISLSWGD